MPLHHFVERIVPAIDPTCDIVRSREPLSSKDHRRIFQQLAATLRVNVGGNVVSIFTAFAMHVMRNNPIRHQHSLTIGTIITDICRDRLLQTSMLKRWQLATNVHKHVGTQIGNNDAIFSA
jgi:hypothetical protein